MEEVGEEIEEVEVEVGEARVFLFDEKGMRLSRRVSPRRGSSRREDSRN